MAVALKEYRIDHRDTKIIRYIYPNVTASLKLSEPETNKFCLQKGVWQRKTISLKLLKPIRDPF